MTFAPYIIGAIFLALFILAVRRIIRKGSCCECHGDCGCCGGSAPQQPAGKKIGSVVAQRVLTLDGLHCANCVSGVKNALEAIPGVAADVTLNPQRAVVRMDRAIPDETLRKAVEEQGFSVVSVNESVES
jgi:Cu2+-exporting ATPase